MGAKKAKRRKPLSGIHLRGFELPEYKDEVLLTFRFPTEPHAVAIRLHAILNKYMFIENGRMLGRHTSDGGFETVLGFVDQDSAARTLENVRTNLKLDLDKWVVAPGSESTEKLEPIGRFFSEEDTETIVSIIASDSEAVQAHTEAIAERMDREGRDDDGRFIFPDLSEEDYNAVRAAKNRKPN